MGRKKRESNVLCEDSIITTLRKWETSGLDSVVLAWSRPLPTDYPKPMKPNYCIASIKGRHVFIILPKKSQKLFAGDMADRLMARGVNALICEQREDFDNYLLSLAQIPQYREVALWPR